MSGGDSRFGEWAFRTAELTLVLGQLDAGRLTCRRWGRGADTPDLELLGEQIEVDDHRLWSSRLCIGWPSMFAHVQLLPGEAGG